MSHEALLMLGCGILKREVQFLIEKNHWPLETSLMASALHCELDKLERGLRGSLHKHEDRRTLVFYGCCHPRMDDILAQAHSLRTEGQNCVEMVLGHERFEQELLAGAFFLFEEWARKWQRITHLTFGTDRQSVIREIFQGDRSYMLGLRTPCSGDFQAEAEAAAAFVGLPLRWLDVGLEHLEGVLREAIERRQAMAE
jgi:hypothetical protein